MDFRAGITVPLPGDEPTRAALQKFHRARRPAWVGRLWSALTGRACRLLRLSDVQTSCALRGSHHAGIRAVLMSRIRGSEGRCEDFDAQFRPLRSHTMDRWVRVAKAHLQGVSLPPVVLIQLGEVYYVRDGHHRISVARAFGQEGIDAEVTVWEVAGRPVQAPPRPVARLAVQPA